MTSSVVVTTLTSPSSSYGIVISVWQLKISLAAVFLTFDGAFVVLCNNLFSIRIEKAHLFTMGIARIPYRKMRTRFSAIRIGSLSSIWYFLAATNAVVFVPIANSPIGSVSWWNRILSLINFRFSFGCKVRTDIIGHLTIFKP